MTHAGNSPDTAHCVLRLFVSGSNARSARALRNLQALCAEELSSRCRVEVVDVLEDPRAADDALVIVTPMLLKQSPPPARRVIGDLSDRQAVLMGLDLPAECAGGERHGR